MKLSNKTLWVIIGALLFTLYYRAGLDGFGAGVFIVTLGAAFFWDNDDD